MQAGLKIAVAGALALALGGAALAGECPADKVKKDALTSGETKPVGVTDMELSAIVLGSEIKGLDGRRLRMRRLEIQPGGIVPWHSHVDRPALIMTIWGTMTEYRSDCVVPIEHRAGEVSKEGAGVAHWWKNNTDQVAVLIAADIKNDK